MIFIMFTLYNFKIWGNFKLPLEYSIRLISTGASYLNHGLFLVNNG